MNPLLQSFIEGPLCEHAHLVHVGLPSDQAADIVLNRVTNEQDLMDLRERELISDCCRARIAWAGLNVYCTKCGEYCRTI